MTNFLYNELKIMYDAGKINEAMFNLLIKYNAITIDDEQSIKTE